MKICLVAATLLLALGYAHARYVEKQAVTVCHTHAPQTYHCH